MTYPYEAIIEDKPRKITRVDEAGRYMLDGGERFELKSPDPKGLPIRSRPLRRVAKLKFDGENWFLDGESAKASCIQAQMKRRANSETHSESQTMQELMERLEKIPFADRWHMVGVAWFNESAATVEGETAEDCEQRRSFLETHGGCGTIEPLPPADCFVPFFLTDFGIISQQPAGSGHHGESYEAVIEGQKQAVNSFCEQGGLIMADGRRYAFERLNFKPEGMPAGEPVGDIFGWPLLEVVRLESWGDDWKWNGEESLDKWLEAEKSKAEGPTQDVEQSDFFTRRLTKLRLAELPPEKKAEVRAVSWFAHDDEAGGWNTPIFLKKFRPVPLEIVPTRPADTKPEEVAAGDQGGIIAITKRFRHTPGFNEVWLDDEVFNLKGRPKARACLKYLIENKAFDEQTARHLETEIDPYVRKEAGGLPKPTDIRIHYYFNSKNGLLQKLRALVKRVGRNGRFYLNLG